MRRGGRYICPTPPPSPPPQSTPGASESCDVAVSSLNRWHPVRGAACATHGNPRAELREPRSMCMSTFLRGPLFLLLLLLCYFSRAATALRFTTCAPYFIMNSASIPSASSSVPGCVTSALPAPLPLASRASSRSS